MLPAPSANQLTHQTRLHLHGPKPHIDYTWKQYDCRSAPLAILAISTYTVARSLLHDLTARFSCEECDILLYCTPSSFSHCCMKARQPLD